MNNKEINNFALNERINNFKKRYNELLLELDNSSFLNLSKFSNNDWVEANYDENLTNLLEENDQVNKNLQLIKKSIKEKLNNLELLSQKSKIHGYDNGEYIETYQDFIEKEKNSFEPSSMTYFRVYDDIERTISKIDRIKEYIEDKVLVKIEESEQEKIELKAILDNLNQRIKNLVEENALSNQIVLELQNSNDALQKECDNAIQLWMNLNSKLDNLELLIDENDDHVKLINNEKDKLITQLENKINDLLFEKSHHESINESITEAYISNVSDIFLDSIHKIFFDTIQDIFALENKLGAKNKIFKINSKDLIIAIDKINATHHLIENSIMDIDEHDVYEWSNDLNEFISVFNNIKSVNELIQTFNQLYLEQFPIIENKFKQISETVWELQQNFREHLNGKSIKKINSVVSEVESYNAKLDVFKQQISFFVSELENYKSLEINASDIINEQYWANLALFFQSACQTIDNELKVILDIKNIFFGYLLPKLNLIKKNYIDVKSTTNEQKDDSEDLILNNNIEDNLNDLDVLNDDNEQTFGDFKIIKTETDKPEIIKNPDEIANDFVEKYNQLTNEAKTSTNNETINFFEPTIDLFEEKIEQNIPQENLDQDTSKENLDNIFSENILCMDDFNHSDENKEDDFNLNDTLNDLFNENNNEINSLLPQDNQTCVHEELQINEILDNTQDDKLSNDIVENINEYVNLCEANGTDEDKKLEKLINDKTKPLYDKIENIEQILYKLLEKSNNGFDSNIENNSFLIQKKYNKNLKLRLIKSKLYHLKLIIEAETDNKYLEIIKGLN